jgi:hypothetical protein
MFCGTCKKDKDDSAFTKAQSCDVCYDKRKAYYEANKERIQANRKAKAAIKNEENQKIREENKRLEDLEKANARAEAEKQKPPKICPYEKLKQEGVTTKDCGTCRKTKNLEEFRIVTKLGNEQLAPNCTTCFDSCKAYYEKNKEKMLAKSKQYKIDHAEEIKEKRRQYLKDTHDWVYQREKAYWERNREHLNAFMANYQRTNKHQRLRSRISSRLREKIKKLKSTEEYLGCGGELEVLLNWIEFQFTEEMNWENHGKHWHLDHVLPIKKFNIEDEEEVNICFSWMNMQPLERLANISKHDKILPEMVDAHIEKLIAYGSVADCAEEVTAYIDKYIPLYNKLLAL